MARSRDAAIMCHLIPKSLQAGCTSMPVDGKMRVERYQQGFLLQRWGSPHDREAHQFRLLAGVKSRCFAVQHCEPS